MEAGGNRMDAANMKKDCELFGMIREHMTAPTDVVPEGWYTAISLANSLGISERSAFRLTRHALETGKAERKKFRVLTLTGIRLVPHYRDIKK